jgi:hypothetical protein
MGETDSDFRKGQETERLYWLGLIDGMIAARQAEAAHPLKPGLPTTHVYSGAVRALRELAAMIRRQHEEAQ